MFKYAKQGRLFVSQTQLFYNVNFIGALNVQGIRNKTGENIKGLEELNKDIMILTETKEKGNGVEILGPYLHFYSGVPKEKRAKRGVSILVKERYKRYITTWEALNENMIRVHINLFGKKLCIFRNLCNK